MSEARNGLREKVVRVADEFAPAVLDGADATLVVMVCDGDGWWYSLRGNRTRAAVALRAIAEDCDRGEGFRALTAAETAKA